MIYKFQNEIQATIVKATIIIRGMLLPVLHSKSPVPTKTKIQLYRMYVRSVLTYARQAWAPLISTSNWKSIEGA